MPFVQFDLYSKVLNNPVKQVKDDIKYSQYQRAIQTNSRSSTVITPFIGKVISIHTGRRSERVNITEQMLGYKLGCFAFTKRLGSSIHNSEHNRKKIAKMRRKITQKKVRKTSTLKGKGSKKKKK